MIHLTVDPERINTWILNVVLLGFFAVEIALVVYVSSLV